jgi:iron(III) transport system permease protein
MLVLVTLASRRLGPLRLRHALGGLGRPTRAPLAATPAVGILALSCCSLPVLLGVVVPLGAVARLFARNLHRTNLSGLRPSCVDSLLLVAAAVAVALVLALAVTYWQHARPGPWARFVGRVAVLGYVLPVMVFALAVLVLARLLLPAERYSDATAFTILAYAIALRMLCFLLVPIGVGLAGLAERFGDLAPTLGLGARGAFRKLQLPYLTRFVGLGLLLVALQSLREVGLTVVLGPFGFEPVATKIYALVRIGLLADSAAWVLALALLGLGPVLVLAGALSQGELGAEGPHAATRRAVAQGR